MAAREERRDALRGGGQDARWANSARCPAGTGAAVARAATHASARQERSMIVGGEMGGGVLGSVAFVFAVGLFVVRATAFYVMFTH